MGTAGWTLLGLIAGAVVTLGVSRYYFRESLSVILGVYVHQVSRVFQGVDKQIRQKLSLKFGNSEVEDLSHIEFLIANEGRNPISRYSKPLSVAVPENARLLDASVLHVHPSGRTIDVTHDDRQATIEFDLLNPGDFFLLKLLVDGAVNPVHDLNVTITAERLPPSLRPTWEPYDIEGDESRVSLVGAIVSLLVAAVGYGAAWTAVNHLRTAGSVLPWSPEFGLSVGGAVAAFGALIVGGLLLLIGLMFTATIALGGSLPPRKRFPLPKSLRPRSHSMMFRHRYLELMDD